MEDYQNIASVGELRQYLNISRKKFTVKVFLVLQFVKKYPQTLNELGAAWFNNDCSFISNSQILGDFLGIKSNSINTNFRDRGFKIQPASSTLIKQHCQLLDIRHWKIRFSPLFSSKSTIEEVESIPSIDSSLSNDSPESLSANQHDFIPSQTMELLQREELQLSNIRKIYYSNSFSKEYFQAALTFVTNLWMTSINPSAQSTATLPKIIEVLLGINPTSNIDADQKEVEKNMQLGANIEYLLPKVSDSSQINDVITFDTFFNYFLKYGDMCDLSYTLREISYLEPDEWNPIQFNNAYGNVAAFRSWFFPDQDKDAAINRIKNRQGESWILYPSKASNLFTLLFKHETNSTILALHIVHDPVARQPEFRYFVRFSDDHCEYRPSLIQILTEVLKLDLQGNEIKQDYNTTKTEYVAADNIANRSITPQNNNASQTELGFPSFLSSAASSQFDYPSLIHGGIGSQSESRFDFFNSQFTCSQIDDQEI